MADDVYDKYCKIPNLSAELIAVRTHFWWLLFGGSFRLTDDLRIPESSPFVVQSERLLTTFNGQNVRKDTSKYRSSIDALFMVIQCPCYTHRSPNVSIGLIFGGLHSEGYLSKVTGGLLFGRACFRDFTVFERLYIYITFNLIPNESNKICVLFS